MLYSRSSKDALCSRLLPGNDLIRERTFSGKVNGAHKFKAKSLPYGLGGLNNAKDVLRP